MIRAELEAWLGTVRSYGVGRYLNADVVAVALDICEYVGTEIVHERRGVRAEHGISGTWSMVITAVA